jgi:plastocyanin
VRRSGAGLVGAVLVGGMAAGVLAGCGQNTSAAATPAPTSAASSAGPVTTTADGTQLVSLRTRDDYVFTPNRFTVTPGRVRLTVSNTGHELTHNFRFAPGGGPAAIDAEIPLLPAGQKQTVTFTVTTPGDYRFECSFHTQLGQVGTMTVGG